jgi:beta-phosphoglucomutase-like phosphatase (HAD superfamily)
MSTLQAVIFDVDGTLADTESAHLAAFNHAFAEQGLDWHWDETLYTRLLEISGGKERMTHYWRQVHPDMKDIDGVGLDRYHRSPSRIENSRL